jgi:hypothetical protein
MAGENRRRHLSTEQKEGFAMADTATPEITPGCVRLHVTVDIPIGDDVDASGNPVEEGSRYDNGYYGYTVPGLHNEVYCDDLTEWFEDQNPGNLIELLKDHARTEGMSQAQAQLEVETAEDDEDE